MKRSIIFLVAMLFASVLYAQYEIVGGTQVINEQIETPKSPSTENDPECVHQQGPLYNFPDEKGGLKNIWKPALSWCISDCKIGETRATYEVLRLLMVASDTYFSFDNDSRMLIRFSDGHVSTLNRNTNLKVLQIFENTSYGTFYKTLTDFEVDDETKSRLMNPEIGVIKIRIVFTNGNKRDYDLPEKYQKKFVQHMIESYKIAKQKIEIRHQNNDDSTF